MLVFMWLEAIQAKIAWRVVGSAGKQNCTWRGRQFGPRLHAVSMVTDSELCMTPQPAQLVKLPNAKGASH